LCRGYEPLDLGPSFHVDHIIPEVLLDDPKELDRVLKAFGLADDFDLNSYANLKPSHAGCNLRKGKAEFKPTPLIQSELQDALAKATKVETTVANTASNKKLHKIVEELFKAKSQGVLDSKIYDALGKLLPYQNKLRSPELSGTPLSFSADLKLIKVVNGVMYLQGLNGMVGQRPVGVLETGQWDCPRCHQQTAWRGQIKCILCGYMGAPYD
jgi:hypothetical protein